MAGFLRKRERPLLYFLTHTHEKKKREEVSALGLIGYIDSVLQSHFKYYKPLFPLAVRNQTKQITMYIVKLWEIAIRIVKLLTSEISLV